jgi:putative ABC transport system substrate-binding protein
MGTEITFALRRLGYVEGRNLIVENRYAEGKLERLPGLARELTQLNIDVIFAIGIAATRAAKEATASVPIIMLVDGDPVAMGLVSSLARPEGNVTGVVLSTGTLTGKRLELLKEAIPGAVRIAFLVAEDPGLQRQVEEAHQAASSLAVEIRVVPVHAGDYDGAFAMVAAQEPAALCLGASSLFFRDSSRIIALAAKYRLPTIYEFPVQAKAGGLMAYGSNISDIAQLALIYADRIFKGAKPADLPVERPTKFELVINLRTAKELGLAIPQRLLLRADELIQ